MAAVTGRPIPEQDEMMHCDKCKKPMDNGEARELNSKILCDDCYIDDIWPRVRKMYYENDQAEFMRRLKETYSLHPQQYH